MLRSLYIRDYALIEELEVEFDNGLNIITGETGAGKSILLGALKLILGERASTEAIRTGAKKAVIEGVFDNTGSARINKLLEDNALEPADQIILRREISGTASRAFVNDSPATLQVIREVASNLIDLHGQHEHQMLLRTETHLETLDNFGGLEGLVGRYKKQYDVVAGLIKERNTLKAKEQELQQQKDLFGFQIEEIDKVDPQDNEEDALETERKILEHAEKLHEVSSKLYSILYEDDDAVSDQLVLVRNDLQDLSHVDPTLEASAKEAESAHIIVSELASFLQDYNARIEFNPVRLETIRERLGELEHLKRRYGGSLSAVLEYRQDIGRKYELANDFQGNLAQLQESIREEQKKLTDLAVRLSKKRNEIARKIEKSIVQEIAQLGIPDSRFDVRFEVQTSEDGWILQENGEASWCTAHPNGMDIVEFFISTNPGEDLRPLARVASGGEISRIMLALKTILAKSERLPILVFDEIDAGISGPVARKVGESMRSLAQYHQIVAITHLPQIAALGHVHFRVTKQVADGRTRSQIDRLSADEQMAQVASLISGAEVTDAALESARELMGVS
ncbi:MAG: DNA repair protein RecN [Rhodothermales bacterium]